MGQEYTNLKCGLLGAGKTGSFVIEHSPFETIVFNTKNPPTNEKLKECDLLISFLPGDALLSYLDIIIASEVPLVCGTTGIKLPQNLSPKAPWILASNFSLSMVLIKHCLKTLSMMDKFEKTDFFIDETHHVNKLDNPSGTALTWKEWLGKECEVKGHRIEDAVGTHILKIKTPYEEVELSHKSLSRSLFAKGALYAAKLILKNNYQPGLYDFHELVEKEIL